MFQGQLIAIYLAAEHGQPMQRRESADTSPGDGLSGDRNSREASRRAPTPDHEVTLIESEAVEAAAAEYKLTLDASQTRRNLVTRGVPLNHLVGRTFRIGNVVLRGLMLCEPCSHLEKMTFPGIQKALIHRGGLRAQVLHAGTLRCGDTVTADNAVNRE